MRLPTSVRLDLSGGVGGAQEREKPAEIRFLAAGQQRQQLASTVEHVRHNCGCDRFEVIP